MRIPAASILASLLIVAAIPAQADTDKTGFYAGIVAGFSYTDLDMEAGPVGGAVTMLDQQYLSSGEFGFVAGYQHPLPRNFFIAAEIEAVHGMGDENDMFGMPGLKIEKGASIAAVLKPGYHINEKWDTFLTLGWQQIEYKLINAANGFKDSDSSAGFLHGIGVNYHLDRDVTLTAEYNRVQPLDVKYEFVPGAIDSRFDPELDVVKVSLKYNF